MPSPIDFYYKKSKFIKRKQFLTYPTNQTTNEFYIVSKRVISYLPFE